MAPLTVRKEERFRESVPVQYHGERVTGEGFIYDLSLSGGRIVGNVPVVAGQSLVLRFSLPGERVPFTFEQVTVRWVKGVEFGVDLGPLPPDRAERFRRVIAVFAEKRMGST
ncbi:MAG TPA: PilZ domain-containing protein [Nitrospira sp.]|nr:PilZ domain-containing protein [Nitrospira sp.]